MKINIHDAEKDAHIFAVKMGNWLGEIMFDLIGIWNQEWIKIETGIDGLRQAMYGYVYSSTHKVDILEIWVSVFRNSYRYAEGDNCSFDDIEHFLILAERYLLLSRMSFGYLSIKGTDRITELERLKEEINLNYGTAVLKVQSRLMFERGVGYAKSGGKSTIPPKILAILADTTVGYIFQLINSKKIKAEKVKGNWNIDVLSALEWLKGRKNCPEWIKRLSA